MLRQLYGVHFRMEDILYAGAGTMTWAAGMGHEHDDDRLHGFLVITSEQAVFALEEGDQTLVEEIRLPLDVVQVCSALGIGALCAMSGSDAAYGDISAV